MSYNQMTEKDYTILNITEYDYYHNGISIGKDEIMVGSGMLTWDKTWPPTLEVDSVQYSYEGGTPIPECFVGMFWSVALYKKI